MADVHLLPASSMGVLQDAGETDVLHQGVPVERELQVAQGFGVDDAGDVLLVGQQHGLRAGEAERGGQGGSEELVVRAPHERIVHHGDAAEHRVLEPGSIEGNLVGNPVDHDAVAGEVVHPGRAELDELRHDPGVTAIHLFDERGWETPFASDDQPDFMQHGV